MENQKRHLKESIIVAKSELPGFHPLAVKKLLIKNKGYYLIPFIIFNKLPLKR